LLALFALSAAMLGLFVMLELPLLKYGDLTTTGCIGKIFFTWINDGLTDYFFSWTKDYFEKFVVLLVR
jgi:hypothetical protein